jgi:hypothetical protein
MCWALCYAARGAFLCFAWRPCARACFSIPQSLCHFGKSACFALLINYTVLFSVTEALDFLTKDMGEDRWLCTLMVVSGWELEYTAAAENITFCPDNFDEFFNQRRRCEHLARYPLLPPPLH